MRGKDEYMAMAGLGSHSLAQALDGKRIRKDKDGNVTIPPHTRRLSIRKLLDYPEPEPREWVLEGLVPVGAATTLFGAGGSGKSTLALDLAISCARGAERWLGHTLTGSAVLYMDFELTPDEQIRRTHALCAGAGCEIPEELFYASAVGTDAESALWSAYEACLDQGVGLLVIDSYGLAMEGEANSNAEVLEFFRNMIEPFIVEDMAVVLVDHMAKGGDTPFGGVFKTNTGRSVIQVQKAESDHYSRIPLILRQQKTNFGPEMRPFGAEIEHSAGEIRVGPRELSNYELAQEDGTKATDRVLLAMEDLREPTIKTISDYTGMQYKTTVRAVSHLMNKRVIDETTRRHGGSVIYETTGAGNAVVWYG